MQLVIVDIDRKIGGDAPAPTVGAESGGTRNPNDRPYDLVYHRHYGVNPFVATEDDSLSTFAVDVDNASWTLARSYIRRGMLPPNAYGWLRDREPSRRIGSLFVYELP